MKGFARQVIITIALAFVIFLVLHFAFPSSIVIGSSMEPNFRDGERLVVNTVVYKFSEPERGDVIILVPPFPHTEDFIKRVIALPGDTVEVKGGVVYVNGKALDESAYIVDPPKYTLAKQTIPEGEYFVLGDNRNYSNDSHTGWLLPRQNIIGKASLAYWPPEKLGIVPSYSLN